MRLAPPFAAVNTPMGPQCVHRSIASRASPRATTGNDEPVREGPWKGTTRIGSTIPFRDGLPSLVMKGPGSSPGVGSLGAAGLFPPGLVPTIATSWDDRARRRQAATRLAQWLGASSRRTAAGDVAPRHGNDFRACARACSCRRSCAVSTQPFVAQACAAARGTSPSRKCRAAVLQCFAASSSASAAEL
jgi:hypothetical protein